MKPPESTETSYPICEKWGTRLVIDCLLHHPVTDPTKRFGLFARRTPSKVVTLGGITSQLTQTFGGPASATVREFGGDKHADFMLRMRLSLDCGCAAFATQGGSDHLFTVESPAAEKACRSDRSRWGRPKKRRTCPKHVGQCRTLNASKYLLGFGIG